MTEKLFTGTLNHNQNKTNFLENLEERKFSNQCMCVSNNINPVFNVSSNLSICFHQFQTLLFFLSPLTVTMGQIVMEQVLLLKQMYGVLIEAQAGFRAGMSTVDNVFVLHGLISHMLNNGHKLYCAFIDFTKAFDYVVRDNLWYKLISLGLRGNILNIIKSMYTSVKSRVKFANKLGNEFECSL